MLLRGGARGRTPLGNTSTCAPRVEPRAGANGIERRVRDEPRNRPRAGENESGHHRDVGRSAESLTDGQSVPWRGRSLKGGRGVCTSECARRAEKRGTYAREKTCPRRDAPVWIERGECCGKPVARSARSLAREWPDHGDSHAETPETGVFVEPERGRVAGIDGAGDAAGHEQARAERAE